MNEGQRSRKRPDGFPHPAVKQQVKAGFRVARNKPLTG